MRSFISATEQEKTLFESHPCLKICIDTKFKIDNEEVLILMEVDVENLLWQVQNTVLIIALQKILANED